ncbi:Stk1 family PASTA domain-containing Ser/Thr kinase [Terrihalobacillus insolitus]|uniref:Stk1 family PASTA domain-containing Ser/Thr kinase n=1 Tax=Terrihalobacillus insolitus TaxID=2950438 RepID=UPI0023408554|nr:Stk1 family PASTA domain-containing Ser/Thr kinase [Terrihalobacillus insolitus]MDC3412898.1 Stk1 family PASTA domain-containing Ser/Thr kinase [Terrihalobacillus insolitus]
MLEGQILNERYKIKKTIGGGGMANVYLARDVILDRDVAIKVLRLEYGNDDEFIARFHREAQSATSLSHPNIVSIYDVGEEDGIYFMAMEYVNGMTLKKYIQTYGPIEVDEAIDIMKQITSAITHAHENDIIHRDIKPQNILIDPYGHVKVTDFGIAVALSATSLTQTNSVLGSVHYLSPEQARGGMANKKSDVYSLGIVLFELLTGRLPFSGQSAVSIALKHLQSDTPSIRRWNPDIPQSIENIVLKATAKDPFHRYDSVHEMEHDLVTALDPNRINEAKFTIPEDTGEATKAIPIITNDTFKQHNATQDTIVHGSNGVKAKEQLKKKKRKKMIWVSSILIGLLTAIVAALLIVPAMLEPDDVTIIDVEGMEYEEAINELSKLNLDVKRESAFSDDIPEGYVVNTDPEAGEVVKEGTAIVVYSSKGKETVPFEDYVGKDYSQTKTLLQQSGYKDVSAEEKYSDKPEGEIIAQIRPQQGEEVVPEETEVQFEISKGLEPVTLTSLVGMSEQDATRYLAGENLSVNIIEENSDDVEKGNVIKQEPGAFQEVAQGSVVDLYISKGPEEKPPVTQTVTFSVPYTGEQSNGNGNGNGNKEPKPQTVRIYVDDFDNDLTEVFKEDSITEDAEYEIKITIPPNGEAVYKVMRDDEIVIEKTVPYPDDGGE